MTEAANSTAVVTAVVPRHRSSCSALYIGLFFKWRGEGRGWGGGSHLDENFVLHWLLKDEAINC